MKRTLRTERVLAAALAACILAPSAFGQEAAEKLPEGLSRGLEPGAFVWAADGAQMVLVPGGKFQRGSAAGEPDEAPVAELEVGGFYIDRHEVTNAQYRKFYDWWTAAAPEERERLRHSDAPASLDPRPAFWPAEKRKAPPAGKGEDAAESGGSKEPKEAAEDEAFFADEFPVVGITWYSARAYARWAGKDLPSEAEWEKAASFDPAGPSKRLWPWGPEAPDFTRCNFDGNVGRPVQPGRYPSGRSACGACDLAGNVWEWCLDFYHPDFYATAQGRAADPVNGFPSAFRVVRGGAYSSGAGEVRPTYRDRADPRRTFRDVGFRCVLRKTE